MAVTETDVYVYGCVLPYAIIFTLWLIYRCEAFGKGTLSNRVGVISAVQSTAWDLAYTSPGCLSTLGTLTQGLPPGSACGDIAAIFRELGPIGEKFPTFSGGAVPKTPNAS
jgi:hypothetical protein